MVGYLEASKGCKEGVIDCCLTSNFDEEYNLVYPKLPPDEAYRLIAKYPDPKYDSIKKIIKEKFGVKSVSLGCGSEDLIIRLNHLALMDHWRVGFVVPIFYRVIDTYTINTPERDFLSIKDDFSQYDAVWLQNPNLFTGEAIIKPQLLKIVTNNQSTKFFVDEAGMFLIEDWEKYSLLSESAALSNLVVLTSFSKLYGISGLRAGFAAGAEEVTSNLDKLGLTFPISSLAEYYLLFILRKDVFFNDVRRRITEHKLELIDILNKKGVTHTNSPTNCLFLKREDGNLYQKLLGLGIQGWPLDNEIGVNERGFVRLTVHSSRCIQSELMNRLKKLT